MESNRKTLLGTIGYHLLGNHSIGPMSLQYLQDAVKHEHITVDEMNWGPVAIVQRLQAESPPFERFVFLCAVEREARTEGQITVYKWLGGLPTDSQIQACVGDAATGVISVENLLVIGQYFKVWGEEVLLVDVEPGPERAGLHLTEPVAQKLSQIYDLVIRLAHEGLSDSDQVQYLSGEEIFADG